MTREEALAQLQGSRWVLTGDVFSLRGEFASAGRLVITASAGGLLIRGENGRPRWASAFPAEGDVNGRLATAIASMVGTE